MKLNFKPWTLNLKANRKKFILNINWPLYFRELDHYLLNHSGLIFVICVTPLHVMSTTRKLAILESLDTLDHFQMEKVLQYIKEILRQEQTKDRGRFRQQAMEQIRHALRSTRA